jgi:hypothetical protein
MRRCANRALALNYPRRNQFLQARSQRHYLKTPRNQ